MNRSIVIYLFPLLLLSLLMTGCGTKKGAVKNEEPKDEKPVWHTCLIQSARATVRTDDDTFSSPVTMQTVHDSMLVISITPMLGMEMMRIEATPTQIIAIDKLHAQYAQVTYAELNRKLTPDLNWDILQQLCAAELPTGSEKARIHYAFESGTIEIVIVYTPRQLDVPVRVNPMRLDKYTRVDVSKLL